MKKFMLRTAWVKSIGFYDTEAYVLFSNYLGIFWIWILKYIYFELCRRY